MDIKTNRTNIFHLGKMSLCRQYLPWKHLLRTNATECTVNALPLDSFVNVKQIGLFLFFCCNAQGTQGKHMYYLWHEHLCAVNFASVNATLPGMLYIGLFSQIVIQSYDI
jgi:hypothetical protein